MKTLASLSGGIDSAAALYLLLKVGDTAPRDVHCYSIESIRRPSTATAEAEELARAGIRGYFDRHWPGIHWIDAGGIDWRRWAYPLGTTQFHALIRGTLARDLDCRRILLGGIAEDWDPENRPCPRFLEHDQILQALGGEDPPEILQPLRHMLKEQVMRVMPEDLLKQTWSCSDARRADSSIRPCCDPDNRLCLSCTQIRAALPVGEVSLAWYDAGLYHPGG